MNPTLIKTYVADAAIMGCRIVKFGAEDGHVVQSAAGTDASIGVADSLNVEAGDRLDVIRAGIADVQFGGSVERGAPVTADAEGCAVAVQAGDRIIGFADVSAESGDISPVLLAFGKI